MGASRRLLRGLVARTVLLLLGSIALPSAAEEPRVVGVIPSVRGGRLVCTVRTGGLPTERARRSMRGGLPSSIDVVLELLDAREEIVVRRRVTFRLAYDLWEEVYRIDDGVSGGRYESIESVRLFLSELDALPVATLAALSPEGSYRLRVLLLSHAIAPSQKRRIGAWITGEGSGTAQDADEREVSLGFDTLIRFFFGGGAEGKSASGRGASSWFRPVELEEGSKSIE